MNWIFKKYESASTFFEIINPKKIQIYCWHDLQTSKNECDWIQQYFKKSLEKINQEQKAVFLLGDFNIKLIYYNEHKPRNEFLDSLAYNSCLPDLIQPAQNKWTGQILTRRALYYTILI